ncbi:MAG TPA: hypothetical protein VLM79_04940 [Kofleriaceae bacterium]|nr:hypothetical protein [Kofleriaceae bacterium]
MARAAEQLVEAVEQLVVEEDLVPGREVGDARRDAGEASEARREVLASDGVGDRRGIVAAIEPPARLGSDAGDRARADAVAGATP